MNLVSPTDPVLWTRAAPVTDIQAQVFPHVHLMEKLMYDLNGAGLAAPQVGISLAFFVVKLPGFERVVINPVITGHGKLLQTENEGCLSFPGQTRPVARHYRLDVEFTTLAGKRVKYELRGWGARVFAHEYDHLNGVSIVDRVNAADMSEAMNKPGIDLLTPADLPGYDIP